VHLEVDGSANMECIGIATNAQLKINGSGKMDALDLLSVDMNAQIHGSGDIYVNCTSQLNASIDGSGKIRYIGNPSVTSSIVGSGSISPY